MRTSRLASVALCLFVIWIPITSATTRNLRSGHKAFEAQEILKRLNKPPLKSIQSPDGDIIDCILINQQPAFDHPLLKNHVIQMRPSSEPKGQTEESDLMAQLWHTVNITCPDGTVPIRRTKEEDLLGANSLEDFGKKFIATNNNPAIHEHGLVVLEKGKAYYGATAVINVWSPQVVASEFSLGQMWISAGSFQDKNINTIEVGWQIYPRKYGDSRPRFFTYWTSSTYGSTGCYNLECPGFVQVTSKFVLGHTVIKPLSTFGGTQYSMHLQIWKDDADGKWWLKLGQDIVGYWPASLFTSLSRFGDDLHFGGEVINSSGDKHTVTQMGSGHFAEEGFGKAAYISKIQFVDSNNNLQDPDSVTAMATRPNCYNVKQGKTAQLGNYFYYGGPGRNPNCP